MKDGDGFVGFFPWQLNKGNNIVIRTVSPPS